ncbi:MAG: ADP-ribosylglycohydrolase family protein, partial [Verrucomicrobiales bacterium]
SDDTSMMLCTAEAIVERFDLAKMGQLFVAWARQSYWTPHGDVFDIGIATRQAVGRLAEGCAPEDAGGEGEYSNGNGSVMRILPVALRYWNRPDPAVADLAARASRLTHRHERSQLACAFFCLLVVRLLRGMPLPGALAEASESFAALYAESPEFGHFARLTGGKLAAADRGSIRSSGYVIHTLEAAVWACLRNGETYSRAVLAAVNLGDDTDTVGAVAGALMGAAVGFPEVPEAWRRELARREDLMEFFGRFVTACLTSGSV